MSIREYDNDAASTWAEEQKRRARNLRRALDPAGYCTNGPWESDQPEEEDGRSEAD